MIRLFIHRPDFPVITRYTTDVFGFGVPASARWDVPMKRVSVLRVNSIVHIVLKVRPPHGERMFDFLVFIFIISFSFHICYSIATVFSATTSEKESRAHVTTQAYALHSVADTTAQSYASQARPSDTRRQLNRRTNCQSIQGAS